MKKLKTTPDGEEPNRFSDLTGYVLEPDEPPTWVDAQANLWAAFFDDETDEPPNADTIKIELDRLRELDAQGKWDRPTRREIV